MGGFMTYQRMRGRNGLNFRKPDEDLDPYFRDNSVPAQLSGLIGDMNRMERDYLSPTLETDKYGDSPSEQCSKATGVDLDSVRKVLSYVFLEQS